MTDIEYIASKLSREDILCQLAEEASELAQAALKLRRASTKTNPTSTTCFDACGDLLEEIADVRVAEEVLIRAVIGHANVLNEAIEDGMKRKTIRWAQRLREKEDKNV